jgi:hypothetical protein
MSVVYVAEYNNPTFYVPVVHGYLRGALPPHLCPGRSELYQFLKKFLKKSKANLTQRPGGAMPTDPSDLHARHHGAAPVVHSQNVDCLWMREDPNLGTALDHEIQLVEAVAEECAQARASGCLTITIRINMLQAPPAPKGGAAQQQPYFNLDDPQPTVKMLAEALSVAEARSTVAATPTAPTSLVKTVTVNMDANALPRTSNGNKGIVADRKRRIHFICGSLVRIVGVTNFEMVIADGPTSVHVLGCMRTLSGSSRLPVALCDLLQLQSRGVVHKIDKILAVDHYQNFGGVSSCDDVFHPTITDTHHYPFTAVYIVDREFSEAGKRALDEDGAPVHPPIHFSIVLCPNLSGFLKRFERCLEAYIDGDRVSVVQKLAERVVWQRRCGAAYVAQACDNAQGLRMLIPTKMPRKR